MVKKYLKNIEDIEALRNTDTKIYVENHGGYFKFINGVLCYLHCDGKEFQYQTHLWLSQEPYIEVEDEPSEDWIGKIGWFYNDVETSRFIDVVSSCDSVCGYAASVFGGWFKHFRPLTPEEVEKYTGYKVVNNEMQANTLANKKSK